MSRGLIHLYCGDGKGKTTAAVGLAVRCAGAGEKVLFFQFLKGNTSSERRILAGTEGVELIDGMENMKFVWHMTEYEKAEARSFYRRTFAEIASRSAEYDMIVLDEIIPAVKYDFVTEGELLEFLVHKPERSEVVLTGREPSEKLLAAADYVTEMRKIKHPFDRGIAARKGVEY